MLMTQEKNSNFDGLLASAIALASPGKEAGSVAALRRLASDFNGELSFAQEGRLRYALGRILQQQGRAEEACGEFSRACGCFDHIGGAALALAAAALAGAELECGRKEQSVRDGRRAKELLLSSMGRDDPRLAPSLFTLSFAEYESGNYREAEDLVRSAMEIWKRLNGEDSLQVSTCLNDLGRICEETGRIDEGIALHRACLAIREKVLGRHPETAFSLGNLGTALASAGRWAEASAVLERALSCYAECGRIDGEAVDGLRSNLEVCRRALANG